MEGSHVTKSGSFRLPSSVRLCRSRSSVLVSESITSNCARGTSYQRLSQSMRLMGESDFGEEAKKSKTCFGIWGRVFGKVSVGNGLIRVTQKTETTADAENKDGQTMKKKRSSWLPDPNRRWPIQGW